MCYNKIMSTALTSSNNVILCLCSVLLLLSTANSSYASLTATTANIIHGNKPEINDALINAL